MTGLAGHRILIVDDERFIRGTIKVVLRMIDHFLVAEAADGDEGLMKVDEFKPHLVLCDIEMPRMGGLAFVSQLRKHPVAAMRNTPVVMLTGHAEEGLVAGAARLQISGYLIKPVSPKLIGAHLHNILGKPKAAEA
jgi:two-component system chemotaxis response regulator CheY